jgi:DNA-binding transcriptional LysR family regulator
VELTTGTTDALVDAVVSRKVEAAFVANYAGADQLESLPAFIEELVVVAPRSHPKIRSAEDVRTDTIISFPYGCAYRRLLQGWLASGGLAPERILELGSYHAIVACVASGTGIAIVPRSVLAVTSAAAGVEAYPITIKKGGITTSLVWRKGEVSLPLKVLREEVVEGKKKTRR